MSDNKRIAKNTLMLYARMGITLLVGLYTSRLVLEALGENDYGIYSVVGGIIIILSFLNSSLSGASQRFINFELGRGSIETVRAVFRSALQLHIIVASIVLILAETIGLWFLNTQMNIAESRMYAANWVYQFSVVTCIVGIMTVPYNAIIVAHERMGIFAWISILEIFLRLIVVICLLHFPGDRLIFYTGALFAISLINRAIYNFLCHRWFPEVEIQNWKIDKKLLKSLAGFSSWSVVGSIGYISHTQGIAILINIFFGTAVNAAQGITNTVNGIVTGFVGNFLTALNPQVVKDYAAGKKVELHNLITRGSRMAFFMVSIFAIPLLFAVKTLLNWWLIIVPPYTAIFLQITLLITLFNSITSLMATAQGATGKIKAYQIVLTSIGLIHLPMAWIFFHLGYPPYSAMIIYLIIVIVLQIIRVGFVCKSIDLQYRVFVNNVVLPCLGCGILSFFPTFLLAYYYNIGEIWLAITSEMILVPSIWFMGLTTYERKRIINFTKYKLHLN